jgi:c-di-AMP phosphodiesterase-like protein
MTTIEELINTIEELNSLATKALDALDLIDETSLLIDSYHLRNIAIVTKEMRERLKQIIDEHREND